MQNRISSIVAKQFILRRSGTYQKQFHRNFSASGSLGSLNALTDSIMTGGITTITPGLLANSGSSLLTLEAGISNPGGVLLPGNWNDRRGIFILNLEVTHTTGGTTNYFIQGYTDSDSFTDTAVDPNMRLYINNVITAIPNRVQLDNGTTLNSMRMAGSFQTLMDFGSTGGFAPQSVQLMRPQDVFGHMKNQDLCSDNILVTDRTNMVGSGLMSTRRRNNNPMAFASSIFNGFNQARLENNNGDYTTGDTAEQAFGLVLEADATNDFFLRKVREANGMARGQSHFSYAELGRAVPNIEMVKNVFGSTGVGTSLSHSGDSQHFAGQTMSTVVAVNLATVIPTIMLECMISSIAFTAGNMISGQMDMFLGRLSCFAPEMEVVQFNQFRQRVLTEVFGPMSEQGRLNVNAEVQCSFHSEFVVDLKVGDDPLVRFVTPAFCDSLYSPVVTTNPKALNQLSQELSVMCDHVSDALTTAHLRKDQIISRSLSGGMTGALAASGGQVFGMPPPVNTIANATSMGGLASYHAQPMAPPPQPFQQRPLVNTFGTPSATSM